MRIACSSLSSAKVLGAGPSGKPATFSKTVLALTLCLDPREALVDTLIPKVEVGGCIAQCDSDLRLLRVDEFGDPMRVLLPVADEGRPLH
jgi:hypothetical protein